MHINIHISNASHYTNVLSVRTDIESVRGIRMNPSKLQSLFPKFRVTHTHSTDENRFLVADESGAIMDFTMLDEVMRHCRWTYFNYNSYEGWIEYPGSDPEYVRDVECTQSPTGCHEYVNVGFNSIVMACKYCGRDK